jgi:hypothetical protein
MMLFQYLGSLIVDNVLDLTQKLHLLFLHELQMRSCNLTQHFILNMTVWLTILTIINSLLTSPFSVHRKGDKTSMLVQHLCLVHRHLVLLL